MVKKGTYWILVIFLLLPFLQFAFGLIKVKPLDGAFYLEEKPEFAIDAWFSGEYQNKCVKYVEDHIGFRENFIRIYNQAHYSIFNSTKSPGCVIGKNGQLFLRSYIEGYLGMTFVGKEIIDEKLRRFKFLQDYLSLKGKTVFFVFAPGKASFIPECIPDEYDVSAKSLSNYEYYTMQCEKIGINYIDLNAYFRDIKEISKYDLYPQNGVHWSHYGMYVGMDSVIRYIEKERSIDIPDLIVKEVRMSDSVIKPDNDVEENMNLVCKIPQPPLPYPNISFSKEPFQKKPKLLVITDSYYWQVYNAEIPHNAFSFGGFWFYGKTAYTNSAWHSTPVDSLYLKEQFLDQDVIMFMGTEATLHMFPYGIVDKAYELFMHGDIDYLTKLYISKIKSNPKWLASTVIKAKEGNNTIDDQIYLEARWMADNDSKNLEDAELAIFNASEELKNDSVRFKTLETKAIEQGVDLNALILFELENELK